MSYIHEPLNQLEAFKIAQHSIKYKETPVAVYGAIDSQKCHLISGLATSGQTLIVTYNELRAREIYEDMKSFREDVFLYPSKDVIFYSADVHSNDIARSRMQVFKQLIENKTGTIVLAIDALLDKLLPLEIIQESAINFEVAKDMKTGDLGKRLIYLGYKRVDQVENPGQFTIRGGILDLYPLTGEDMIRVEFWGDEVDSIRKVNAETQRSTSNLDQVTIYPAREIVVSDQAIEHAVKEVMADYKVTKKAFSMAEEAYQDRLERGYEDLLHRIKSEGNFNGIEGNVAYYYDRTVSFLDYLTGPIVFVDEPARIKERLNSLAKELGESLRGRYEKGYLLKGQVDVLHKDSVLIKRLSDLPVVLLSTLSHKDTLVHPKTRVEMMVRSIAPYHNSFDLLVKDIEGWCARDYKVLLLSGSKIRGNRLVQMLRDRDIRAYGMFEKEIPLQKGAVYVALGSIHKGFEYPHIQYVILTETELAGAKKHTKQKKFKDGKKLQSFHDLKPGDYVVHENHGVGVFKGIEKIEIDNVAKDFIKISYKDNGNLYIATTQLDVIQKYISADGKQPKLNKLGTGEWHKTKARVKGAVEEIAKDLIALYAKREATQGHAFNMDSMWQKEFEEMFPYDETDDQLTAIEDTKKDMESGKIMDRLICGDVGYGKTEVAIRAAFKAVQDGKQVAYLVPTTILAQQQYNNFVQRMKDFPLKVEMLSRFRTPKEQKHIVEGLKKGVVDIIIGTHRLVSKDIHFKDLGLLIIDEEQRFGVKHKEQIKQMKETIDVLTLTATPIPRTLHMSLIGIRDMSVLEDPPRERHPIQTYVLEHNEELIKDAIYRELARDGQVYYVYNRVKDIDQVAAKISLQIPEANVKYAHGQMSERELENIMFEFISGEIDVLVATTIIETGLDISNVNTMIIEDADHMGLSQLYQLRGRVGRSNRVAYAYLLYKRDKVLREIAEKRLEAIREFTEFGAGFKIAMRDLEIRGAGNLLGAKQHGHMDAVGYDLYCKMLEKEVKALRKESTYEDSFETTVDINVDAFIPGTYIEDEMQKIEAYKKIASIEKEEDYRDIQDELLDRYGDMPKPLMNLLEIALIKAKAHQCDLLGVTEKAEGYVMEFKPDAKIDPLKIPALTKTYGRKLVFTVSAKPYLTYRPLAEEKKEVFRHIKTLLQEINDLKI